MVPLVKMIPYKLLPPLFSTILKSLVCKSTMNNMRYIFSPVLCDAKRII